jgi:pimeloyl-ACP methyl ester carboxylesterase
MSDHSERKSVNSRRTFIVGVTGALVAAPALTETPFADDLSYTSRAAPRRNASRCRIAKEGSSNVLRVNGISLHVEDHNGGKPVLLLHGWPDSSYLWRNQIPFLVANGFRVIAPDLRGFGRSDRPEGVGAYSLQNAVADVIGILDALGIDAADVVAHDWGAAVAWLTEPPPSPVECGVSWSTCSYSQGLLRIHTR